MKKKTTGVFDENGHRVVRNPETTHRMKDKVHQINPYVFRLTFVFQIEDVAKLRQYCRGKEIQAVATAQRKVRKPTRKMSPGRVIREYIQCLVKDVQLDAESMKWVEEERAKRMEIRKRQDAMIAAGVNRIPKDQQLKRGAKPKKRD